MKTISVGLPVVIGRGTDSTLTIKHPLLSRRHCEVYEESGQVFVKDLASLNGTFVNDARVETALPLISGTQLKLGAVEMKVSFEGGPAADNAEADFEMGAVAVAQTETMPVAEETSPADVEEASFDLSDFEVNEVATAEEESSGDEAGFDLADFEVSDVPVEEAPEVGDAVAEAESLDLGDFEVSTPEVGDAVAEAESLDLADFEVGTPEEAPAVDMLDLGDFEVAAPASAAEPEAQVELPSLMDLAGGLEEDAEDVTGEAPAVEIAPAPEVSADGDDPWAPPADPQVNADDDDLDAFLADLD